MPAKWGRQGLVMLAAGLLFGVLPAAVPASSADDTATAVDAAEQARGEESGRERTKIEAWHELLDLVRLGRAGGPPSLADRS